MHKIVLKSTNKFSAVTSKKAITTVFAPETFCSPKNSATTWENFKRRDAETRSGIKSAAGATLSVAPVYDRRWRSSAKTGADTAPLQEKMSPLTGLGEFVGFENCKDSAPTELFSAKTEIGPEESRSATL